MTSPPDAPQPLHPEKAGAPASNPPPPDPKGAEEWIQLLFDPQSFIDSFDQVRTPDPLRFSDSRDYRSRVDEARTKTGHREAVETGLAWLGGQKVIAAVSDFRFIGGSMGFAVGERVVEAMDEARRTKTPFVAVTCSGGARMQEGIVALVQMTKTAGAAQRLHEAGIPMITVLASPTTGGVYASYATQADLIIAERDALIGFAGPRVRALADPNGRGALHAGDLHEAGLVDCVLPADQIRPFLIRAVELLAPARAPDPDSLPPAPTLAETGSGWDAIELSRHPQRPRAVDFIARALSDYVEIRGDRNGDDDQALLAGFARIGVTNIVIVAQNRGFADGRMTPAGYRKAQRAMQIAERLQLPLVTLIDTPGAHDALVDEAAGLAGSISNCLTTMAAMTTPSVAVVIGEGGSGGALALSGADHIIMQENASYTVTSPEGAAAILYRDRTRAPEVAEDLGVRAADLKKLNAIDTIVPEPPGGAQNDPDAAIDLLHQEIRRALSQAMKGKGSARRRRREKRFRSLGKRRLASLRDRADASQTLNGVSELAVHALDAGRQLLGDRFSRAKGNGKGKGNGKPKSG